ncbi:MAG: phosphoenolpyruvate--protein phosphotransferase [Pyrinomonadaceae bacterium]|nr:phosphoenolpyruvate--protein phosphotransferase [Pyrinomonadaceae bacterium]
MTAQPQEVRCKGLGVSEGVVIGQVMRLHDGTPQVYRWRIASTGLEAERQRFRAAVDLARERVQATKAYAEERLGRDHAYIFDAHLLMLDDERVSGDIEREITVGHANAEWAVKVVGDRLLSLYSEIKDDYLRARVSDVEDVMQRLLVALSGARDEPRDLSEDAVIVAQDLLPSAVAELDLRHARALATDSGGWTSHTAILARGIGIPAVVGLRDFYRRAKTGDRIIVDSNRNEVILHPSEATLDVYQEETAQPLKPGPATGLQARSELLTTDGVEIILRANVEVPSEFAGVAKYGARGVGLYRSEFLLAHRGVFVSEDVQRAAYEEIAKLAGDDGAVVRLFDLGAATLREGTAQFPEPEKNPALGLRAIRFSLRNEEIMRTQVRAILLAAKTGRLQIVLPMVADLSDVRRARAIVHDEATKLAKAGRDFAEVKVGAMIEVPAAVLMSESIARAVDFFELGTNDLVQYTLAVDRGNDEVADWFRTLHPAVLHSIERSLSAARTAGIPAIVCGEMASTPAYAVLLIGLGATELSMTPSAIPRVRGVLAGVSAEDARAIARDCLSCSTADDVEDLVRERFTALWPDLFPSASLPAPRLSQNRER